MDQTLQDGINAFKAGRRDEARRIFIAMVKAEPRNENAWGWLYQVANNDQERMECLKKVLAINPNNSQASNMLKNLQSPPYIAPVTNALTPSPAAPTTIYVQAPSQPKKNNWVLIISAAVLTVLGCCICISLSYNPTLTSPTTTDIFSSEIKIKYVVSGTAPSASITYTNKTGGTEQVEVNLPFEKEFTVTAGGTPSIVAQSGGSGSITCEIWVNGEKKKTSTSTAQYGVVTCSDFVY